MFLDIAVYAEQHLLFKILLSHLHAFGVVHELQE